MLEQAVQTYRDIAVTVDSSGFQAYLVVELTDKDISFGGTRIDPSVTREMVVDLADNMSLKLAGHGSPVGGAKAGLRASPNDPRLKQFLRRFAEGCREQLTNSTILGKDMGAKQWMIDHIYASLQMPQLGIAQRNGRAATCPDRMGDLSGYIKNMTGQGTYWSIEQAAGGNLRGARVLIQGFGVVGAGVAWHLCQHGAVLVGVSDRDKAVVNEAGMALDILMAAKGDEGIIDSGKLPASWIIADRDSLLARRADILILAAGSYVVDADIAAHVQAPLVVEGANLALLPVARKVLHARAVHVIPDVVANSSSAAMVALQIASGNTIAPQVLWSGIEASIKRNTEAVQRLSRRLDIDSKSAFRGLIEIETRETASAVDDARA
jgi:glutamate dehydrogenase (NAD(P)+)